MSKTCKATLIFKDTATSTTRTKSFNFVTFPKIKYEYIRGGFTSIIYPWIP